MGNVDIITDDIVFSDDLMPNDGDILRRVVDPEEQVKQDVDRAHVTAARPLFDDIISWFDERIELACTIHDIDIDDKDARAQLLAQQKLTSFLTISRDILVERRDQYLERQ